MLMEQYYDRVKLRRLARECATQAQTIGVILVGEASFLFFSVVHFAIKEMLNHIYTSKKCVVE